MNTIALMLILLLEDRLDIVLHFLFIMKAYAPTSVEYAEFEWRGYAQPLASLGFDSARAQFAIE